MNRSKTIIGHKYPCPESYADFINTARSFVESKGLTWMIPCDSNGRIQKAADWDLRKLTNSHVRCAAYINNFTISQEVRTSAIIAGWPIALLPEGLVLSTEVQEYLKAFVGYLCIKKNFPRVTRHRLSVLRKFFSSTNKRPWEISSDDFDRYVDLVQANTNIQTNLDVAKKLINERLLSVHIPITRKVNEKLSGQILTTANSRAAEHKLPDPKTLRELIRIIFHEVPEHHQDRIRFGVSKMLIFTGLRLNEVLMLPADCLHWEDHIDIVTGRPAGEVGGVSRSLFLRYFGEKRSEGTPDRLVEDFLFVPEIFHKVVQEAIQDVLAATQEIREILAKNSQSARIFHTTSGDTIMMKDLLFLVIHGVSEGKEEYLSHGNYVEIPSEASFHAFLGGSAAVDDSTIFTKYGKCDGAESMKINPHSLRHLQNTDLLEAGVPDTVVTAHFGRTSVVQTYEYDHRTLGEKLSFVEIPKNGSANFERGSTQELVAKMVISGFAESSHISKSFKKIQAEHGDNAAFAFLAANSDGFHITPYGFCTNSFAITPCVRHLKCFHKCSHYVASGIKTHIITLTELRTKLVAMKSAAERKPATSIGRKNQISHAEALIAGVDAALNSQPNEQVFKDGVDHSLRKKGLLE